MWPVATLILLTPLEILFTPLENFLMSFTHLRGVVVFLTGLTVFLYVCLKKISDRNFIKANNNYQRFKDECNRLSSENSQLKDANYALGKTLEETIALYDITHKICKSLDDNEIFNNFCEQINRYIRIGNCRFIKEEADLLSYDKSTVLPLRIDKSPIGYLVVTQIRQEDKEKFYILAQQFILGFKRALLYQKVSELAITDSLTQASSRRYLMERFNEEIERSKKFKYNFSFLMVDVDHFKDYNDRYGHLVGDAILREVAKAIKENIRQIDLVGRYGGEEFSVILTETNKEGAGLAAERIRSSIENRHIRIYDEDLRVTISIGVSVFPEDASEVGLLIEKADQALYQAKQAGRNRVWIT